MKTKKPGKKTILNAIKVGKEALSVLKARGWCQGVAHDHAGRVCATAAIGDAAGKLRCSFNAENLFRNTCSDVLRSRKQNSHIVNFNDAVARSPRAVYNLFNSALKKLARKAR